MGKKDGGVMKYDPQKHNSRLFRLRRFDYSQPGCYFVTHVIMPNHVHGILEIMAEAGRGEVISPIHELISPCWGPNSQYPICLLTLEHMFYIMMVTFNPHLKWWISPGKEE